AQQAETGLRRQAVDPFAEHLELRAEVLIDPEHQRGEFDLEASVRERHQVHQARRPFAALERTDVLPAATAEALGELRLTELARGAKRTDPRFQATPNHSIGQ